MRDKIKEILDELYATTHNGTESWDLAELKLNQLTQPKENEVSDDEIQEMVLNKFPLKQGGRVFGKNVDMQKRKAYYDGAKWMREQLTKKD